MLFGIETAVYITKLVHFKGLDLTLMTIKLTQKTNTRQGQHPPSVALVLFGNKD
jgi:hypothetical protein